MPVARFVCPYCEKPAEVQVTSVTRSRPCPHCGKAVMIQVASRDRKGRHRAMLIAPPGKSIVDDEAELVAKPVAGPAYSPMPLEGEVFERMKLDPEVRAFRQRLYMGFAFVVVLIVGVIFWSPFTPSPEDVVVLDDTPPAPLSTGTTLVPQSVVTEPEPSANAAGGTAAAPSTPGGVLSFRSTAGDSTHPFVSASAPGDSSGIVLAVVEKFLRAEQADDLLETVAARQRIEPAVRRYVTAHGGIKPTAYSSLKLAPVSQVQKGCDARVLVTLKDGSVRDANVIMENAVPRVDWPSFVALSEVEWPKFMVDTPASPMLFRVLAVEGDRFDGPFADSKSIRCLRLQDPNNATAPPLFAYVEKAGSVGEELDSILRQSSERPVRLTLRLHFPMDPQSHDQVWIDSVVAIGWVIAGEPSISQVSASH